MSTDIKAPPQEVLQVIQQELSQTRIRLQALKLAQIFENTPVRGATTKTGHQATVRDFVIKAGSDVPRGRKLAEAIEASELCLQILEEQQDLWDSQQEAFDAQNQAKVAALRAALDAEEAAGDAVAARLAAE